MVRINACVYERHPQAHNRQHRRYAIGAKHIGTQDEIELSVWVSMPRDCNIPPMYEVQDLLYAICNAALHSPIANELYAQQGRVTSSCTHEYGPLDKAVIVHTDLTARLATAAPIEQSGSIPPLYNELLSMVYDPINAKLGGLV